MNVCWRIFCVHMFEKVCYALQISSIFFKVPNVSFVQIRKSKSGVYHYYFSRTFFREIVSLFFFFVSDIWGNWQLSFFFYCITIYVQRQKRNFHHYIAHSKIRGILQRLVKKIGLNLARNLFSKKKPSCNLLQNYISLWLNVKKRVVYEIQ